MSTLNETAPADHGIMIRTHMLMSRDFDGYPWVKGMMRVQLSDGCWLVTDFYTNDHRETVFRAWHEKGDYFDGVVWKPLNEFPTIAQMDAVVQGPWQ